MTINSAKKAIIKHRREWVAQLRLRGATQRAIVQKLVEEGVVDTSGRPFSLATINADIQVLEREWREHAAAEGGGFARSGIGCTQAIPSTPGGKAQLHQPADRMDARQAGGAPGAQGDAYGMGWVISPSSGSLGVPSIWHGGDTANFHSDMIILPQQQWGIVVLMNVNGNFAMMSNAQGIIAKGLKESF